MKRSWLFIAVFAAGLLLRVGYAVYTYKFSYPSKPREMALNTDQYDFIALNILRRGEISIKPGKPTAFREPFYPLLLAASHLIGGDSPVVGIVLNIFLGMSGCWIIYCLTKKIFANECVALLALALSCFYPEWICYVARLYREPLIIALLALWAWLWASYGNKSWSLPYILMGIVFGLTSLTRAPMIPLGAFFVFMAAYRLPRQVWLKTIGTFLLLGILVQAPWIMRNYLLLGRFVAGASKGGSVTYLSLLFDYDKPQIPLEQPLYDAKDEVIREIIARNLTEDESESLYYKGIWHIFTHRPGVFWAAFVRKAIKLWRPYPYPGGDYGDTFMLFKTAGLLSNCPIMILGLVGAFLAIRSRLDVNFLLMVPLVLTFVHGITWSTMRCHSPLMIGVIPLAAFAAYRGFESFRDIIFPRVVR